MRIRDLLDPKSICLSAAPVSKEDAITTMVDYLSRSGCLKDELHFRDAVFERESKSSTGLGEGIAIPHAKSDAVLRPALASMVVPNGVDFDSIDDEPVHLLFMIASPQQASDAHLDVLARLSTLLMNSDFRASLLQAKSVEEYLAVIDRAEDETDAKAKAEAEQEQALEQAEAAAQAHAAKAATSAAAASTSVASAATDSASASAEAEATNKDEPETVRIRDLLDPKSICLSATPKSKEEAISTLVDSIALSGCIQDKVHFRDAVLARENESSTGFGEGIAIPHAKSDAVLRPALASMVVPNGVDFDAFDDEPVHLLFLIASPQHASGAHLDVLARLSTLLMSSDFRADLLKAKTVDEYLEVIDRAEAEADAKAKAEQEQDAAEAQAAAQAAAQANAESTTPDGTNAAQGQTQGQAQGANATANASATTAPAPASRVKHYDIVAVTACPAGLSHTYMAAEALEQKAKELGISIKVEADGAAGNRNSLLPEEIAAAKAVIVAADRAIVMDRFVGKRMVRTGVVDGVHKPEELIKKALKPDCPVYQLGSADAETSTLPMKLYRHLMSGLTYILPLAATAGILSAVARMDLVRGSSLGLFLDSIGYSIGTLLFPILSAFIAFSIAGRMALVAGVTGGVMADMAGAGVIGTVLNGFVGGAVALLVARAAQRFLKGHDAMFALLVYPLAGAVFTTLIAQLITNLPAALLDHVINDFINSAGSITLGLCGVVLAGMMSADMGGPFNKISYATGVLLLADCLPENGPGSMIMASVMLGGMVPPIAAGLAARILAPRKFTKKQRKQWLVAIFKGMLFVTEGVIPYLVAERLRIACIAGSAVAGGLSMYFRCAVPAPHGGVFLMPIAVNPLYYVGALGGGIVVGAIMFAILMPSRKKKPVTVAS